MAAKVAAKRQQDKFYLVCVFTHTRNCFFVITPKRHIFIFYWLILARTHEFSRAYVLRQVVNHSTKKNYSFLFVFRRLSVPCHKARPKTPTRGKSFALFLPYGPIWARALLFLSDFVYKIGFNPRTHTGCDTAPLNTAAFVRMFQSTHPHGVRLLVRCWPF